MPYHQLLDTIREQSGNKIGTTGRGIGPAYIDKALRVGIKIVDLLNRDVFVKKLKYNVEEKNKILKNIYGESEMNIDAIVAEYEEFDKQIDEYVTDTSLYLNKALREGKKILAEGAQGSLLDVDHGTYPFVTSSNPTSGGACTGLGIPPTSITSAYGVAKAYATRVGNGPFPTELTNEIGERLREIGGEYGATTGRPRRCGWFDAFSVRYTSMINGIKEIAITKLDVLDTFDEIKVCVAYQLNGKLVKSFRTDEQTLNQIVPLYETYDGWKTPTSGMTSYNALPVNAKKYIEALGSLTQTEVTMVSVGARRDQTIRIA
jgi:adenylosuccinate synthase